MCVFSGCRTVEPAPLTVEEIIQQSMQASDRSRQIGIDAASSRPETNVIYPQEVLVDGITGDSPSMATGLVGTEPVVPMQRFSSVSEEFVDTDLREALITLAEKGDVDLVMDDKVNGVVSTKIDNLTLDQAFEKVLMPLGLYCTWRDNQVVVAPADPASPLFPYVATTVDYRAKHVDVKTLMTTVPLNMTQYVKALDGTNQIMIEAPEALSRRIEQRFAIVDQPVPQVVLEAIICVVSPDTAFQLGLDWQHAVELNGDTAFKLGATGLAMSASASPPGVDAVFSDFATTSAFVKMLSENGYLTIRASPHVMAKSGEKANISINRETFFSVSPQSSSSNSTNSIFFQQNIQKVDAGITLEITPTIRDDLVTIKIDRAEVSEDVRQANSEAALNPYPIINRRSVSTTVHVKDGKTIVIGGLVQRETVDRVNEVPGLSKIPLMGYLFKSKQRQTREADVIIFISPRIIQPISACEKVAS